MHPYKHYTIKLLVNNLKGKRLVCKRKRKKRKRILRADQLGSTWLLSARTAGTELGPEFVQDTCSIAFLGDM
jgi:hypothetical protein